MRMGNSHSVNRLSTRQRYPILLSLSTESLSRRTHVGIAHRAVAGFPDLIWFSDAWQLMNSSGIEGILFSPRLFQFDCYTITWAGNGSPEDVSFSITSAVLKRLWLIAIPTFHRDRGGTEGGRLVCNGGSVNTKFQLRRRLSSEFGSVRLR